MIDDVPSSKASARLAELQPSDGYSTITAFHVL
jgi:hypothetical protein